MLGAPEKNGEGGNPPPPKETHAADLVLLAPSSVKHGVTEINPVKASEQGKSKAKTLCRLCHFSGATRRNFGANQREADLRACKLFFG